MGKYLSIDEKRSFARRDLENLRATLGPEVTVDVIPNNMLAGPCTVCRAIGDQAFSLETAPLPPFEGCSHPDQCACSLALHSYVSLGERVFTGIAASYRK